VGNAVDDGILLTSVQSEEEVHDRGSSEERSGLPLCFACAQAHSANAPRAGRATPLIRRSRSHGRAERARAAVPDIVARLIGQGLQDAWGQTLVIDNRGGAGGIPGVTTVAKQSAPDGYTMLLGSNGHLSFAPAIRPNLPFDPQKDLTPGVARREPGFRRRDRRIGARRAR
jgi:hypothetical protein